MNTTTTLPRQRIERHRLEAPRITFSLRHVAVAVGTVVALLLAGLGASALLGSDPAVSSLMLRNVEGHELVAAGSGRAGEGERHLAIRADVAARLDAHVRTWRGESSLVVAVLYRAPDDETAEQAARLMQASWVDGTEVRFDVPGLPDATGTRRVHDGTTLDAVVFTEGSYGATLGVVTDGTGGPSAAELALAQAELIP